MAEGGALMMISTLWKLTTLGGRAFSQPEGLFEWFFSSDKIFQIRLAHLCMESDSYAMIHIQGSDKLTCMH